MPDVDIVIFQAYGGVKCGAVSSMCPNVCFDSVASFIEKITVA